MLELFYFAIAFLTAGAALVTGLISLFIGLDKDGKKADILFGLMALSLFTFILLPPSGFILEDKQPYPLSIEIKRIFSWSYYIFLAWFLEFYSGYKKRILTISITLLTIFSYFLMISASAGNVKPAWQYIILLPLSLILILGLLAARHMIQSENNKEGKWLLASMLVYFFLFSISIINIIDNTIIERLLGRKIFFPLNLNHLAFIIIMGMRLQKNTFNKFRLENILRMRNKQWENLFQAIQLFIVEMDKSGKILFANPYTIQKLGYTNDHEVLGLNWFDNFIPIYEINKRKSAYAEIFQNGVICPQEKSYIKTREGEERIINWTRVLNEDETGNPRSILYIGSDATELDHAFRQVQIMKDELEKENLSLRLAFNEDFNQEIIGKSEAIIYAIQKARQVSVTHSTVLLEGETGVGKELFADLIHKVSLRNNKPLIKINCAALPPELIESELFGHEKGSFTGAFQTRIGRFEQANGGTIFLDEIGELPLSLQPKLLRVLQSGEFQRIGGQTTIKVDVRIISATNRDLMQDVKAGRFREDLYYRLNVFPITVPALRNRKEDIQLLIDHFIKKFALEFNKPIENISRADLNRLIEYNWPGNIRELINLIERSVISSNGETLRIDWEINNYTKDEPETRNNNSIKEHEKEHILKVLKDCNGKINGPDGAAEILGINPNTLRSRMKKLNISRI